MRGRGQETRADREGVTNGEDYGCNGRESCGEEVRAVKRGACSEVEPDPFFLRRPSTVATRILLLTLSRVNVCTVDPFYLLYSAPKRCL
jgi:hypothetical protein